jgi:hypothetical protein
MRRVIIVLIASIIIVLGIVSMTTFNFSLFTSPPEDYFLTELEDFPWVKYAFRQNSERELTYYNDITSLYSLDKRFGLNFLNTNWIREYISPEEGTALHILVQLSEIDPALALNVSQTSWFQNKITSIELNIMEDIIDIAQKDVQIAHNLTGAPWFLLSQEQKVEEGVHTIILLPVDLARAITKTGWFRNDQTLSELRAVHEFDYLYQEDDQLALTLITVYQSRDYPTLHQFTLLYKDNPDMINRYFTLNSITRNSMLALSNISRIATYDREFSESLVEELTPENLGIVESLASIYSTDPALGGFAREHFQNNRIALRYMQKVSEIEQGSIEPELMERVGLFVITNPEFVYEDRIESYRYHLLTQIISELPLETCQNYKNLIFVTCSIYGNRFYLWQNTDYGTLEGWSSDKTLRELERRSIMQLITFFIEKNEQGALVTDLRMESQDYIYGVLDIPFTHLINYDGTMVETSHKEQGTSFVFAILYNINTLHNRFPVLQNELTQGQKLPNANPLVELIIEEGDLRDHLFLQLCEKNWILGDCNDHTMHTRMDSIVMGISTTTMQWTSPESAHIYPAYLPSTTITEKIQEDPGEYGNPFVYKGFIAPYDQAGFRDSLDRSIETVKIYDIQADKEIGLFNKTTDRFIFDEKTVGLVIVGFIILLVIFTDTLRIIK